MKSSSLLFDPERHELFPAQRVWELGATVVVAPHPDDESLGCGGVLALLAEAEKSPKVIVVTDGSRSHPNSKSHPQEKLAELRERETLLATEALGLRSDSVHFLRYRDCGLPPLESQAFTAAAERCAGLLEMLGIESIFVPWRRDPHCDHELTWQLFHAAVRQLSTAPRWLEYPVWAWEHAATDVAPREEEASAWRLDISTVADRKNRAIQQHRSQLGEVIRDDPKGFALTPAMLAHFSRGWELFIEPKDG